MGTIDLAMYKLFKELKQKYTPVVIKISQYDIASMPKDNNPRGYVQYVERLFKDKGLEVTRFSHNYKTNELGLVFLASDSVIVPGYEVWGLVGYNLKEVEKK